LQSLLPLNCAVLAGIQASENSFLGLSPLCGRLRLALIQASILQVGNRRRARAVTDYGDTTTTLSDPTAPAGGDHLLAFLVGALEALQGQLCTARLGLAEGANTITDTTNAAHRGSTSAADCASVVGELHDAISSAPCRNLASSLTTTDTCPHIPRRHGCPYRWSFCRDSCCQWLANRHRGDRNVVGDTAGRCRLDAKRLASLRSCAFSCTTCLVQALV
jgi:hypothetical protein